MKRRKPKKYLSGAQRLAINDDIYEFITRVVKDGVRNVLGPKATKEEIDIEIRRRYLL